MEGWQHAGKFCHWIDRSTLRKQTASSATPTTHGDYFAKEFDINRTRIETWYLCADRTIFTRVRKKKPAELQDKFVVLYFGSVLPVQGVDVIMQAMQLLANDPRIHFDFIGPIAQKVKKAEGDNITYINWLSQPELAEAISRADLCLAGHFNRENGKANRTIPGKAYIYEAMEKPMILGDSPANHERYSASQKYHICGNGRSRGAKKCHSILYGAVAEKITGKLKTMLSTVS